MTVNDCEWSFITCMKVINTQLELKNLYVVRDVDIRNG